MVGSHSRQQRDVAAARPGLRGGSRRSGLLVAVVALLVLVLSSCGSVGKEATVAAAGGSGHPAVPSKTGSVTEAPEVDDATPNPWVAFLTAVDPGSAIDFATAKVGWRVGGLDGEPHLDSRLGAGPNWSSFAWPGESLEASSDGGRTWTSILDGTGDTLHGVWGFDLLSPSTGWAVGVTGLEGTDDGGKTWQQLAEPAHTHLVSVDFTSATDGWGVTTDGTVVASTDGGRSWTGGGGPSKVIALCRTAHAGYAVDEKGTVWVTSDDGGHWAASWDAVPFRVAGVWAQVTCTGSRASVLESYLPAQSHEGPGELYNLVRTDDAGRSWDARIPRQPGGPPPSNGWPVAVATQGLVGGAGRILLGAVGSSRQLSAVELTDASPQLRGAVPVKHGPMDGAVTLVQGTSAIEDDLWALVVDSSAGTTRAPASQTLVTHSADAGQSWQILHADPKVSEGN